MVTVHKINRNGEIWRKLLNSVADKHECNVRFTHDSGEFGYEGERACAKEIVKETVAIFTAQPDLDVEE